MFITCSNLSGTQDGLGEALTYEYYDVPFLLSKCSKWLESKCFTSLKKQTNYGIHCMDTVPYTSSASLYPDFLIVHHTTHHIHVHVHWLERDVMKERLTAHIHVQQCTHFWLPLSSLCSHTEFSETLTRTIKMRVGSWYASHSRCHTHCRGDSP